MKLSGQILSNPLTRWMKSVYYIALKEKKKNQANKSHWSHTCSAPKAAAKTLLDLEVECGLPHVRDVRFFQVLEGFIVGKV